MQLLKILFFFTKFKYTYTQNEFINHISFSNDVTTMIGNYDSKRISWEKFLWTKTWSNLVTQNEFINHVSFSNVITMIGNYDSKRISWEKFLWMKAWNNLMTGIFRCCNYLKYFWQNLIHIWIYLSHFFLQRLWYYNDCKLKILREAVKSFFEQRLGII